MTKIVAIDFETANSSPLSACSVGVTVMQDGVLCESWSTLIHPVKGYDEFFYHNIMVHGIIADMVKDAPTFDQIYGRLCELFEGAVLVAHNAEFDMKVLSSLCHYYQLPVFENEYFCTVRLSRTALPFLQRHRLNVVAEYFGIELDHHEASSDARACALIVMNIMALTDIYEVKPLLNAYRQTLKKLV